MGGTLGELEGMRSGEGDGVSSQASVDTGAASAGHDGTSNVPENERQGNS